MIVLDSENKRNTLMNKLSEYKIESNIGANAVHLTDNFKQRRIGDKQRFVNSKKLFNSGLVLPMHQDLQESDIEYIVAKVVENC